MIACPCCANLTLEQRAADEICPVCFWHDYGQDDADAAVVRGGPNYRLSLTDARYNYRAIGACEARFLTHARAPTAAEARR